MKIAPVSMRTLLMALIRPVARNAPRQDAKAAVSSAAAPSCIASELVVDAVIEPEDLRAELIRRFEISSTKNRSFADRRNPVTPA